MTSDYNSKFDRSNADLLGPNRNNPTALAWSDLLTLEDGSSSDILGERERAYYDAMMAAREAIVEAGDDGAAALIEGIVEAVEARVPLKTEDEIADLWIEIQAEHIDCARAACDELDGDDDDDVWNNICLCAYPRGFSDLEQRIINAYYNK